MGHFLNLANYDWVALDAVGTLIVPAESVGVTYQRFGARFGSRLTVPQISQRFSQLFSELWSPGTPDRTSEESETARWRQLVVTVFDDVNGAAHELFPALWAYYGSSRAWRRCPDSEELVDRLQRQHVKWGIASNFDHRLHDVVATCPQLSQAHFVVTSADLQWSKSSPEFYRQLSARLNPAPGSGACSAASAREAKGLMVGDHFQNDICSALAAGWDAAWINAVARPDQAPVGQVFAGTLGELVQAVGQAGR